MALKTRINTGFVRGALQTLIPVRERKHISHSDKLASE